MPVGPPRPDLLNSYLSPPNGFPGSAEQPGRMNSGGGLSADGGANWPPLLPRIDALPMRLPPQPPSGGILGAYPDLRGSVAGGGGILSQFTDPAPGQHLQAGAPKPSIYQPSADLSFDRFPSASNPLPNMLVPPQANWAAPPLPLFANGVGGDEPNVSDARGGSGVLSDAYPEPWISNAQYASRTRRGRGRASEPELSPAEEIRWMIYNHNLDVLGELEPNNRLLLSIHNGRWVPSPSHIRMVKEEIARARDRQPGRSSFEGHHNLPRQFETKFNACGLDIEDYVTYLARDLHRLRPGGLHTGSESWNKIWRRYFAQGQTQKPSEEQADEILNQLFQMWEKSQWLRR